MDSAANLKSTERGCVQTEALSHLWGMVAQITPTGLSLRAPHGLLAEASSPPPPSAPATRSPWVLLPTVPHRSLPQDLYTATSCAWMCLLWPFAVGSGSLNCCPRGPLRRPSQRLTHTRVPTLRSEPQEVGLPTAVPAIAPGIQ